MDVVAKAEEVLRGDERLVAAYLFGSYAKGTARTDSDVDIAILFSEPTPARLGGASDQLARRLETALDRDVDVVDLSRAPADLVHRVLRDGLLLMDRDRARRIAFEVRRRAEYLDLKPYLDEYRRAATR